ncbi:MAG: UDP-N-acetylglucosamine diphosphorylase/glucosamine-1-phosphate N-acetyltransferase, partial [Caldisericia bacterium]|nr:UDP-N-acetylglucosamine diphosphorylase/glucosamine-1-phosphate N-acetyltransferase [Caldisericia bacterium]
DEDVKVGPFVRMRPPIEVKVGAKIGCFIDIKKSIVGKRSKVPHLSYIGDTEMGEDVNIGAGTITCNYDGKNKFKTKIGNRVFTGSDTMLIAPIELGDDSYTGAGSVISGNVSEGDLAIERTKVRIIKGWGKRKNGRNNSNEGGKNG